MSIEDFDQKDFIKEVRAFMKKHELSVRKFARLSGVSFATLYRLEQGVNEITLSTIRRLQKTMDDFSPS